MKIAVCGSMAFVKEMKKIKKNLETMGHIVLVPDFMEKFIKNPVLQAQVTQAGEHWKLKKKHDLIRKHYQKIKGADAILVLNYTKKGIKNYIGGNSFLEMGFAHILTKPIYLINPLPKQSPYLEEMAAMEPIVLNGDLKKVR